MEPSSLLLSTIIHSAFFEDVISSLLSKDLRQSNNTDFEFLVINTIDNLNKLFTNYILTIFGDFIKFVAFLVSNTSFDFFTTSA